METVARVITKSSRYCVTRIRVTGCPGYFGWHLGLRFGGGDFPHRLLAEFVMRVAKQVLNRHAVRGLNVESPVEIS